MDRGDKILIGVLGSLVVIYISMIVQLILNIKFPLFVIGVCIMIFYIGRLQEYSFHFTADIIKMNEYMEKRAKKHLKNYSNFVVVDEHNLTTKAGKGVSVNRYEPTYSTKNKRGGKDGRHKRRN